jgi:hypothetical protein
VIRSTGLLDTYLGASDRGFLQVKAPVVLLDGSKMTTTNHFLDLSGAAPTGKSLLDAQLVTDSSVDATVHLVNASILAVNGHFLNLMYGANASVDGILQALSGGSTLQVNGTGVIPRHLVHVETSQGASGASLSVTRTVVDLKNVSNLNLANGNVINVVGSGSTANVGSIATLQDGSKMVMGNGGGLGGQVVHLDNGAEVTVTGTMVSLRGTTGSPAATQVTLTQGNVLDLVNGEFKMQPTTPPVSLAVLSGNSALTLTNGHVANVAAGTATLGGNVLDLHQEAGSSGTSIATLTSGHVLNVTGGTATIGSATVKGSAALLRDGSRLTLTNGSVANVTNGTATVANGNVLDAAGADTTATLTTGSVLTASGGTTNVFGSVALLNTTAQLTVGTTIGTITTGHIVNVSAENATTAPVTVTGNILDLQGASQATLANGNVVNLTGTGKTVDVTGGVAVVTGGSTVISSNRSGVATVGHVVHLENGAQATVTGSAVTLEGTTGQAAATGLTLARGHVLDQANGTMTLAAPGALSVSLAVLSGNGALTLTNGSVANIAAGIATVGGNVLDLHQRTTGLNPTSGTSMATLTSGHVLNVTGGTATIGSATVKGSAALLRDGSQLTLTNGSVANVTNGTATVANGNVLDAAGTNTTATLTTGSVLTASGGTTNVTGSVALLGSNGRLNAGNGDVARIATGTVAITGNMADLQSGGTLNANAGQVLNQSGGTVTTQGNLAFISGATANVARIANVTAGTTTVLGNGASVLNGGVVNLSGDSLLNQLGGTVTIGSATTNINGDLGAPGSGLFLSGNTSQVNFATTAHLVNIGVGALNVFGNVATLVGGANLVMPLGGHLANVAGIGVGATSLSVTGVLAFLDASRLTLNDGHLLNLARTGTGATSATFNGGFFSLVNGSTLSLSGKSVLANVGAGTELNLAGIKPGVSGPTLGFFGAAGIGGLTNALSIGNTLCSGGAVCTTVAGGIRVLGQGFASVEELNARIIFETTQAQAEFAAFRVGTGGSATVKTANNVTTTAINLETALLTIQKTGTGACTDATCGKIVIKR